MSYRIFDGVFAIDKPKHLTSAQAIRNLQVIFNRSQYFEPLLRREKSISGQEHTTQTRRRKLKRVQVKIGHGGTLDPLAMGVLIVGVGKGTKQLQKFLDCTKKYEAVLLFGTSTDTYDLEGSVTGRASWSHITPELVKAAIPNFQGEITQKPPIYSALRIRGRRLYEYARKGIDVSSEIMGRLVTVEDLQLTEWLSPGSHDFGLPLSHFQDSERNLSEQPNLPSLALTESAQPTNGKEIDNLVDSVKIKGTAFDELTIAQSFLKLPGDISKSRSPEVFGPSPDEKSLPAVRLAMTVSSGFYVRSLCHEIGKSVSSLGVLGSLIRTRQGSFCLDQNVMSYTDFQKDESIWAPRLEALLRSWKQETLKIDPAEANKSESRIVSSKKI